MSIKNVTFENFVIGPENRLAHAAAVHISENSGNMYNPLYIYGPDGAGKTHLLHGIDKYIRTDRPYCKTKIITAFDLFQEFIDSVRYNKLKSFLKNYKNLNVLMIDDFGGLQRKEETQSQLFHILNFLYEQQKQIILTGRCHPNKMSGLDQRLISLCINGLVIHIEKPEGVPSETFKTYRQL